MTPAPTVLVGSHEIAEMLGVSKQRVDQLTRTDQFPAPIAELKGGRVWLAADVGSWALSTGRVAGTRYSFKIGEAFPADDHVAVFLTAVATGLNDLVMTSKMLVGGDEHAPFQRTISDVEHLYVLRLSIAQLYELRETIKAAKKRSAVRSFLDCLPKSAMERLAVLLELSPAGDRWIEDEIKYLRNQTFHYGLRPWEPTEWALGVVADDEGDIVVESDRLAGLRMRFADQVATQHFLRGMPEQEPTSDDVERRVGALFRAVRTATSAALDFATEAIRIYLDQLPNGTVEVHDLKGRVTRRE